MNHRRIISLALLVVVLVGGGLLLHGCLGSSADRARIHVRYDALQVALRAGDTNALQLLFAPAHRARAMDHVGRFQTFALPLDHRSGLSIKGARVWVCPRRDFSLIPFVNFGHTIEMIRVGDEWYFTGRISIW
jgi:hypothetical protein